MCWVWVFYRGLSVESALACNIRWIRSFGYLLLNIYFLAGACESLVIICFFSLVFLSAPMTSFVIGLAGCLSPTVCLLPLTLWCWCYNGTTAKWYELLAHFVPIMTLCRFRICFKAKLLSCIHESLKHLIKKELETHLCSNSFFYLTDKISGKRCYFWLTVVHVLF